MKCRIREEDLALYSSGDLDAERSAELRLHLAACADCRQTASDLKWTAQFVAAPFGPPSKEDLGHMREAITAGLRKQQRSRREWPLWSAAAAVLLVTGIVVPALVQRGRERPVLEQTASQESSLAVTLPAARWTFPNLNFSRRPVAEAGVRGVSVMANSSGKAELRLATADPDVVILLPMDGETDVD